jgi:hypothetical protein
MNSTSGRNFTLNPDLSVKSSTSDTRIATQSNIIDLASAKHIATFERPTVDGLPVQGPLAFKAFQEMAKTVHDTRPGMPSNLNTVSIFQKETLPPTEPRINDPLKRRLDVSQGVVMQSNSKQNTQSYQPAVAVNFGRVDQKNHFEGIE